MFALVVAGIDTAPLSRARVFFVGVEYNYNDQETNVLSEMRSVSKELKVRLRNMLTLVGQTGPRACIS